MITVCVMGHTYVKNAEQPVRLPTKTVALLTYLTLERQAHHRDHLADLLWDHPDARLNLRVELNRLRANNIPGFPQGQRLLSLEGARTDLELWEAGASGPLDGPRLEEWLAALRGLPLSGLDDLGSLRFRMWLDHQRQVLDTRVRHTLEQVYLAHARAGRPGVCARINARLTALGHEPFPTPDPPPAPLVAGEPHFKRRESAALQAALQAAHQGPQVLVLSGAVGSGKSYEIKRLAQREGALLVYGDAGSLRLTLASIAQTVGSALPPEAEAVLTQMLHAPRSVEEDAVGVASALRTVRRPLMLCFENTDTDAPDLAGFLQLLGTGPAPVLIVLTTAHGRRHSALIRTMLGRLPSERLRQVHFGSLTIDGIVFAVQTHHPRLSLYEAERLAQTLWLSSDGSPLHLRALLLGGSCGPHLPADVRQRHDAEIELWPPALRRGLEQLSLALGPIDERLVAALEASSPGEEYALLREAHELGALCEDDPADTVLIGDGWVRQAPHASAPTQAVFRSEALRICLAGRLPAVLRRRTDRQLAQHLADADPGLAAFHARRAGELALADALRQEHARRVGRLEAQAPPPPVSPASAPPRAGSAPMPPLRVRDYLLSNEHGWLRVHRRGPYGHARTLRVRVALPSDAAGAGQLQFTWRLEHFTAALELGPLEVPFPLGVRVDGRTLKTFGPHAAVGVGTDGLLCTPQGDVTPGVWMQHSVTLAADRPDPHCAEFQVRALDIALSIASISWNGRTLLPRVLAAPLPEYA